MADRSGTRSSDGELIIWFMRRAIRWYGAAIRSALDAAGHRALPQQGLWAVNALDAQDRTAAELVEIMQITKQAVSQLVESLVTLGYVERHDDPTDKRRVVLRLSASGRAAAAVTAAAAAAAEREAARRIGPGAMLELRSALQGFADG